MVSVSVADITKLKDVDLIVNAANGCGIMGLGVAGAIKRAAGDEFADQVRKIAMASGNPHSEGQVYVTPPGKLAKHKIKGVLHAVTMKYPGSGCSYGVVEQCLYTTFNKAIELGMKSIAVPGLGTGIGNLDPEVVAHTTVQIALKYADRLDIKIVDINKRFIQAAQQRLDEQGQIVQLTGQ